MPSITFTGPSGKRLRGELTYEIAFDFPDIVNGVCTFAVNPAQPYTADATEWGMVDADSAPLTNPFDVTTAGSPYIVRVTPPLGEYELFANLYDNDVPAFNEDSASLLLNVVDHIPNAGTDNRVEPTPPAPAAA
jgi:hypothetical protein